jgi:hypothetical protein
VIKAGPGPNRIKIKIIKTSPMETTADNLGSRMFIVAMKSEVIVKKSQGNEKLFAALKVLNVTGIASRYTAIRYRREALDWSFQFT